LLDGDDSPALVSARFGAHLVTADDIVFGDKDDVLFRRRRARRGTPSRRAPS
jgi:hypothetical protein